MDFKEFSLHPDLQRGIAEAGYISCMPVQEQVLTNAFGGQDLYVQSQTGTGKTAAFLVVIYQRLLSEDLLKGKKALIMAPTRELAVQIEEEARMLSKYLPFDTGSFYGGVGYTQQEKLLRENVQIMVGTPGRVLDLNKSGRMNLMDIAFLVLDEADRMFDMGFYPDLRKLIRVVPPVDRRQTMLFSATLNAWVKNLAWEYTKSPFEIEIEPEIVTVEEIDQVLYHVPSEEKMKLLLGILEREKPDSAIIFCNTKRYTEIVAKRLRMNGYDCEFIIGDLPQSKRLKVIDDVKAGKIKWLVATDVAARGLDIESLSMVVNYDLPVEAENYVHRIGRTARAGKSGRAITLASEQDVYELPAIERYIGKKIPSEIALPELHAEDKSAGQHIRTEYYEDRREERHLHGKTKFGSRGGVASGERHGDRHGERRGEGREGGHPSRMHGGAVSGGRRGGIAAASGERGDRHGGGGHGGGEHGNRHGGGASGERGDRRRENIAPGSRRTGGHKSEARRQGAGAGSGEHIRKSGGAEGRGNNAPSAANDLSHLSFDERMNVYKQKYDAGGKKPSKAGGRPDGRKPGGQKPAPQNKAAKPSAAQKKPDAKQPPDVKQPDAASKKGILSRFAGLFKKK